MRWLMDAEERKRVCAMLSGTSQTLNSYLTAKKNRKKEQPMRVTYTTTHHDDKPCERRVEIPDGWEEIRVHTGRLKPPFMSGEALANVGGHWQPIAQWSDAPNGGPFIRRKPAITLVEGDWYEVESGGIFKLIHPSTRPDGCTYRLNQSWYYKRDGSPRELNRVMPPRIINRVYVSDSPTDDAMVMTKTIVHHVDVCKKCATGTFREEPFRLTGPGWYRTRQGSWVNLTSSLHWKRNEIELVYSNKPDGIVYGHFGKAHNSNPVNDLIARATDSQAKILDGL